MSGLKSSLEWFVSPTVFNQLLQVLREFGEALPEGVVLTQAQCKPLPEAIAPENMNRADAQDTPSIASDTSPIAPSDLDRPFMLVQSPQFQVLLLGQPGAIDRQGRDPKPQDPRVGNGENLAPDPGDAMTGNVIQGNGMNCTLTFHRPTIEQFLSTLAPMGSPQVTPWPPVETAANDPWIQSDLTLRLVEVLSQGAAAGASNPGANWELGDPPEFPPLDRPSEDTTAQTLQAAMDSPSLAVCQPITQALQWQISQDRLLTQVTAQIRESLELETILRTAIAELRRLLAADRVVIYRFNNLFEGQSFKDFQALEKIPDQPLHYLPRDRYHTFEALTFQGVPSLLDPQTQPTLIHFTSDWITYSQGKSITVDDTEQKYQDYPALLESVRRMGVRSRFTMPILVQGSLWGLIAAHHCRHPYPWSSDEQVMVEHIADHMAIAIHQSQLYQELQQQKATLEQRVQEYTQELQGALAATQAAHHTKSKFLAIMSHELRTPLTCIIGMSSTLLRWSFGSLSQRQRSYLQTIHDSGENLLAIINDILELSCLEAGKSLLNCSEFSLHRLVHSSAQLFQEKAHAAHITLHLEVKLGPDQDNFLGDFRRCQQILTNLISNAIKFTLPQGKVTVRIWRDQEWVVFEVADTGIGIPLHEQPLLFQNFQQLEDSRNREHGGAGLGLALTKQLVELHGGNIALESEVGVGSKFTVWLPLRPSEMTKNRVISPTPPTEPPGGQVVLVEEDEETAILICELLTTAGYQVIWLVDGSTALEQIEVLQPVAVIANLTESGIGGTEVLRGLRRSPYRSSFKVVALVSDQANIQDLLPDPAHRPDFYIRKPFVPDQLVASLLQIAG